MELNILGSEWDVEYRNADAVLHIKIISNKNGIKNWPIWK